MRAMLSKEEERSMRKGPIFASIGTVLIDCFDSRPTSKSSQSPSQSQSLSQSQSQSQFESSSSNSRPGTPSQQTSNKPKASTPQLDFDDPIEFISPDDDKYISTHYDEPSTPSSSTTSSPINVTLGNPLQSSTTSSSSRSTKASVTTTSIIASAIEVTPVPLIKTRSNSTSKRNDDTKVKKSEGPVEVLGGGALYALIGARIWLPPNECKTLVDRGRRKRRKSSEKAKRTLDKEQEVISGDSEAEEEDDLSRELEKQLDSYGKECWEYLEGEGKRMIRARIRYDGDVRVYKHLVPPVPRSYRSLLNTSISNCKYLHISPPFSPSDVHDFLNQMQTSLNLPGFFKPKIVFEPTPQSCHPGERKALEGILSDIEVLSPNHEELLSLYGKEAIPLDSPDLRIALESIMEHLLNVGIGKDGKGIIVVRCNKLGSVVGSRKSGIRWVPAYWGGEDEKRVKDVTGAGNAYLGGFIAGLSASNGDPLEAALYGTISASFVVEQVGLPSLNKTTSFSFLSLTTPIDPSQSLLQTRSFTNATAPISSDSSMPSWMLPVGGNTKYGDKGSEKRGTGMSMGMGRGNLSRSLVERPAEEMWNNDVPSYRLEDLRNRIKDQKSISLDEVRGRKEGSLG